MLEQMNMEILFYVEQKWLTEKKRMNRHGLKLHIALINDELKKGKDKLGINVYKNLTKKKRMYQNILKYKQKKKRSKKK